MGSYRPAPPDHADLCARVEAVLKAHENPKMTDEGLSTMCAAAVQEFRAALRDRGTDPERFTLVVHVDELVGPMAFVVENGGEKRHWPLTAFQAWLSLS